MSPSRQPSSSQRAGAGPCSLQAVRWSALLFPLPVAYPGAANRLAQVLLCHSSQEAASENDAAQSRSIGAESPRGSAAADVAGSVHFQKEKCGGCFSYTFCYAGEAGDGALRNRASGFVETN